MTRLIGLRDYVIQASDDLEVFRRANVLGFDGVEAGPTRQQLLDPQGSRLELLRKAAGETGLAVPCLSLNQHNQGGLGSDDRKIRESAIDDVRRCFDWAAELGTGTLLLPFFGSGSLENSASRERAIQNLTELCMEAAPMDIRLAYEGDLSASDILEMAEQINSPVFGCYYDLANPLIYGRNPLDELPQLKELLVSVHIKDFRARLGDCRPGEGQVPLGECAKILQRINYEGWLVLETPPASVEVVAGDLEYVRKVFLQ